MILTIYATTFILRVTSWALSVSVADNRPLAVASYLYGLAALLLTLRAFGHMMEGVRGLGAIQIAFFLIIRHVAAILWQFVATILAFSMAITKVFVAERYYLSARNTRQEL